MLRFSSILNELLGRVYGTDQVRRLFFVQDNSYAMPQLLNLFVVDKILK